MKFRMNEERLQHSAAWLIPSRLWRNEHLFNQDLPDDVLPLMRSSVYESELLQPFIGSNLRKRRLVLLVVSLSHPYLSFAQWHQIGVQLEIPSELMLEHAALCGRYHYFIELAHQHQAEDTLKASIAANHFSVFRSAALSGNLAVLDYLVAQAPELVHEMLAANDYEVFRDAHSDSHSEVVDYLLSYTDVFVFAELDVRFNPTIESFITAQLASLDAEKAQWLEAHPDGPSFNVIPDRARHLFYMARALIRRNGPVEQLNNILSIPEVGVLVHQEVTQGSPNELARLVIGLKHVGLTHALLTLPEVLHLTQDNGFYSEGMKPGVFEAQLLIEASHNGSVAVVRSLLARGVAVDHVISDGMTALMIAAQNGHTETIQALLDGGAAVDHTHPSGVTALMIAAHGGHTEAVLTLLARGASVNHIKINGATALKFAVQKGHTKTVLALLEGGAEVNYANSRGFTALMVAAKNGYPEIVRALIKGGATINHATQGSSTPLMMAALNGHTEIVNILLDNDATVDLVDQNGRTALMHAVQSGHTQIVRALLARGAAVNLVAHDGWTAIELAEWFQHHEIVVALRQAEARYERAEGLHTAERRSWREIRESLMAEAFFGHGADTRGYEGNVRANAPIEGADAFRHEAHSTAARAEALFAKELVTTYITASQDFDSVAINQTIDSLIDYIKELPDDAQDTRRKCKFAIDRLLRDNEQDATSGLRGRGLLLGFWLYLNNPDTPANPAEIAVFTDSLVHYIGASEGCSDSIDESIRQGQKHGVFAGDMEMGNTSGLDPMCYGRMRNIASSLSTIERARRPDENGAIHRIVPTSGAEDMAAAALIPLVGEQLLEEAACAIHILNDMIAQLETTQMNKETHSAFNSLFLDWCVNDEETRLIDAFMSPKALTSNDILNTLLPFEHKVEDLKTMFSLESEDIPEKNKQLQASLSTFTTLKPKFLSLLEKALPTPSVTLPSVTTVGMYPAVGQRRGRDEHSDESEYPVRKFRRHK